MNRETDYQKYVYIHPPVEIPTNENNPELFQPEVLYELFLGTFAIYEHKDVNMVKKARETFLEALKEIQSNQKLRKLAEQYHEISLEIPKQESEVRKELIRLLEQPPTALKLVNNELCPYMKGREDKELSQNERILIDILLKYFPAEERGFLVS